MEIDRGASMPGNLADVNMHIGCYTKLAITVPIYAITVKDENGRKRSKTDLRYRKTKTVGSGYFYI
jgi:hypothetical protein